MNGFFPGTQTPIPSFAAERFSKPQAFLEKKHNGGDSVHYVVFTNPLFNEIQYYTMNLVN